MVNRISWRKHRMSGKTGDAQINMPAEKHYALNINLGGNDEIDAVVLQNVIHSKNTIF